MLLASIWLQNETGKEKNDGYGTGSNSCKQKSKYMAFFLSQYKFSKLNQLNFSRLI